MKHSTYHRLYRTFLGNVDEKALLITKSQESDQFYQTLIQDVILNKNVFHVQWDTKPFTTDFRSSHPKQKLEETFMTFILRLMAVVKGESYEHMFLKPESHDAVLAWVAILRNTLMSSLALLYNVEWTMENVIHHLEPTILKFFNGGDPSILRQLMTNLGIELIQKELYPAEVLFGKLNFLHVSQFGSFYWRFLHWMAEAVDLRDSNMSFYKNLWRELLKGPLYRTLKCVICMDHFKTVLKEKENRLTDESDSLAGVFFEIHNKTHAYRRENNKFLNEPDYSKSEYDEDSQFMRQALSAK